jgi:hypothetical protein
MGAGVSNTEIIETLTSLNHALSRPVWLFGGVAVDFLVGRWTRPHGDIDLNAYREHRTQLTHELNAIGFYTNDTGWLTHWAKGELPWRLEIAFLEPGIGDSGILVIQPDDPIGVPGSYATLPGYLDPNRRATLDGVTFRVCSPSGEWLARAKQNQVFPNRPPDPKVKHDLLLLETIIPQTELRSLRDLASQAPMM